MVIDAGGNVGDSQAAKLGSHFSLMMVVSVPTDQLDSLKEKLSSMHDMNAAVFEAEDVEEKHTPAIGCKSLSCFASADDLREHFRVNSLRDYIFYVLFLSFDAALCYPSCFHN